MSSLRDHGPTRSSPADGIPVIGSYPLGVWTVVPARGDIDLVSAPVLRQRLADAIGRHSARVIVDLTEVTFMDSTGLDVLAGALRAAQAAGGEVCVLGPCAMVRAVLHMTGLDRALAVHATLGECASRN